MLGLKNFRSLIMNGLDFSSVSGRRIIAVFWLPETSRINLYQRPRADIIVLEFQVPSNCDHTHQQSTANTDVKKVSVHMIIQLHVTN
jgi:hypothetical protein